jgi:hypothetical protein|tara:strand:+ start:7209 stop:7379 length:171 start_codon:yes stop_codon:yes gene_type:complete
LSWLQRFAFVLLPSLLEDLLSPVLSPLVVALWQTVWSLGAVWHEWRREKLGDFYKP